MIPHIPNQRQSKTNVTKPFNELVSYIEENKGQEKQHPLSTDFENILNYATAPQDKATNEEKCIAIRTHGIADLSTAATEMNAVSARNTRCKDPAFHLILSWPEHEHPEHSAIFDAAEHAIKSLGLADHQYILAVHANTDNTHCHIAVNRIHPTTYRSHNIEWAKKTLHLAARESELKHNWTHDNGIYIVEVDAHNKKRITINPDHANSVSNALPHAHQDSDRETALPPWHDPDSLESWLKTDVSRALKRALPKLRDWNALHAWLAKHDIKLTDTGGGGMRLHAASTDTGEVLDLPASKGLRILKRSTLETRWGTYTAGATEPNPYIRSFPSDRTELTETGETAANKITPCIVPDLSHLTQSQLTKGINHVLKTAHDRGIPPNPAKQLLHAEPDRSIPPTHRRGSLHELSPGSLDGDGHNSEMLLPDSLRLHLGDGQPRQDPSLRRPGSSQESSRRSLTRDNSKREERREQRAAARADLRQRFSQYQRYVREGDADHWNSTKANQAVRNQAIKTIREETRAAKTEARKNQALNPAARLHVILAIDIESTRRKLQAEAHYQAKALALQATHQPPLGWREWLHEQANLGDQAALSALRGIVYQAQRDAKYSSEKGADIEEEKQEDNEEYRARKYRQLMARLLEEEKKEIAIRSANRNAMRPYEVDALLARYTGIQYRVTGNGNIEYSDRDGEHLFTDRGNRVTFDRARVTDEEIRLALVHAQQKYGKQITLTGDDPTFAARMARLADDMNITILNPELQLAIANHRDAKSLHITQATIITPTPIAPAIDTAHQEPAMQESEQNLNEQTPVEDTPEQRLRAMVLSIDPRATFIVPDPSDSQKSYTGPVAATLNSTDNSTTGFAQHIGRSTYALHPAPAPAHPTDTTLEVQYRNSQPVVTNVGLQKGKGRNE